MKVVSVLTSQGAAGGAEFAAASLLDALAGRGHDAVLHTDTPEPAAGTRVTVRAIDLGPKLSKSTVVPLGARAPMLSRRLAKALEAEWPYDALLLHFKKEQLLALALPGRLKPRVAWAEWGPVPFPLRTGVPNRLYRRAGSGVAAVLAISDETRRSVLEASGIAADRAEIVPNVMDSDTVRAKPEDRVRVREELGIPDDAFVVGCISRFNRKKRNDVAIDAAIALAADPDARETHLVMAGDGETEAELRARAAPLGAAAHFVPTPGDRVVELLSAWDVAVFCPSPTEGAPRAIMVAMLCERPVVSTGPEGAVGLVGDGAGAIAEPEHDAIATAALLRHYRDDPDRRRQEGETSRARVRAAHDPDAVAAQAERLVFGGTRASP